jgi:hypothetical protein
LRVPPRRTFVAVATVEMHVHGILGNLVPTAPTITECCAGLLQLRRKLARRSGPRFVAPLLSEVHTRFSSGPRFMPGKRAAARAVSARVQVIHQTIGSRLSRAMAPGRKFTTTLGNPGGCRRANPTVAERFLDMLRSCWFCQRGRGRHSDRQPHPLRATSGSPAHCISDPVVSQTAKQSSDIRLAGIGAVLRRCSVRRIQLALS